MYLTRKFSSKTFYYARTEETKERAQRDAQKFREEGYLARIIPVKYYFGWWYQVFVYPEDTRAFTKKVDRKGGKP